MSNKCLIVLKNGDKFKLDIGPAEAKQSMLDGEIKDVYAGEGKALVTLDFSEVREVWNIGYREEVCEDA